MQQLGCQNILDLRDSILSIVRSFSCLQITSKGQMIRAISILFVLFAPFAFVTQVYGQIDDVCREAGIIPSLDLPRERVPYVYGRVVLLGVDRNAKAPRITVILNDTQQMSSKQRLDKTGNYCFRRVGAGGGSLTVEVDGVEVARRALSVSGPSQQREDFEVYAKPAKSDAPPGAISAKFIHPPNEKTSPLYRKVVDAEREDDTKTAEESLTEIVLLDPVDFVAWAKLGTLYLKQNKLTEAEAALRKSLELKVEYTPAWIHVAKVRMAQKRFEEAAEILKHASTLEPSNGRIYQLLGEAYLQGKKGSLGAEALKKALELDPIGLADCHLLLGRLYDLAGAKGMAAAEYKAFLEKVSEHPDRKKLEKYIRENSDAVK